MKRGLKVRIPFRLNQWSPGRHRIFLTILLCPTMAVAVACGGRQAIVDDQGGTEMKLKPCPNSPNCVSSQAEPDDRRHYIRPLAFAGSATEAISAIRHVVESFKRTRIQTVEDGYLHAVFVSALFRFRDDVEFVAVPAEGVIHVRSASRVGYGDLGANRKRVEQIRTRLAALGS